MMHEERRRAPRHRAYLPVRVSQTGRPAFETLTKDIGLGGIRCVCPSLTPVGCEVTLEISVPRHPDVILLKGRATWFRVLSESEQFELGIAFLEMPENAQKLLTTYLEHASDLTPA